MESHIEEIVSSSESQECQDDSWIQEKEKIVRGIACPQIDENICICGNLPHHMSFHSLGIG